MLVVSIRDQHQPAELNSTHSHHYNSRSPYPLDSMEVSDEIMVKELFTSDNIKVFDFHQDLLDLIVEVKDLNDRVDCLQRSVANLRGDLPQIIHIEIFHTLDQRNRRVYPI